jgi:hypothetical protein
MTTTSVDLILQCRLILVGSNDQFPRNRHSHYDRAAPYDMLRPSTEFLQGSIGVWPLMSGYSPQAIHRWPSCFRGAPCAPDHHSCRTVSIEAC